MLRNLADALGKNILREVLHLRGLAETEAEVPPGNPKRLDLWFVPEDDKRGGAPPLHDVLAAMAAEPGAVEAWSDALSVHDFRASMTKRDLFHETLELRDKRRWNVPMLWHICAGKPETVLFEFGFVPADVPGWYRLPNPGLRVQIVVLSELPAMRSTLLLRLLGQGRVRRDALRELRALPNDAWEKQLAYPWLVRVGLEVPMERWALHEDREFVMDIQAWYKDFIETHDRQVEARVLQGLEAQRAEERRLLEAQRAEAKRQAELGQLVHLFERRLGRQLATNEHVVLGARIEALGAAHVGDLVLDLSADELATWLKQGEACTNG